MARYPFATLLDRSATGADRIFQLPDRKWASVVRRSGICGTVRFNMSSRDAARNVVSWSDVMRFLVLSLAFLVSACELMSNDRIPTEDDVRGWSALQPVVAACGEIRGVYQNVDVDSVVFYCRPRNGSEAEFWRQVRERSSAAGWVEDNTAASGPVKTFQRLQPRRGQQQLSSSEEIRVAWIDNRILVGYVQADHSSDPRPVRETSEGRFAEKSIWPHFIGLLSQ